MINYWGSIKPIATPSINILPTIRKLRLCLNAGRNKAFFFPRIDTSLYLRDRQITGCDTFARLSWILVHNCRDKRTVFVLPERGAADSAAGLSGRDFFFFIARPRKEVGLIFKNPLFVTWSFLKITLILFDYTSSWLDILILDAAWSIACNKFKSKLGARRKFSLRAH